MLKCLGSKNHFVYDPLASKVKRAVSEKIYGVADPHFAYQQAQLV